MRSLLVAVLLALLAATAGNGYAARDLAIAKPETGGLELVVLELRPCVYCDVFRRDVLPNYQSSPHAKDVPIRFVDINEADLTRLGLAGPVAMVPTVVLLRDGREAGRIAGLTAADTFMRLVGHMLGR